jgi:hypothetical protein
MPTVAPSALAGSHRDDVLDPRHELHAALRGVRDDLRVHVRAHVGDAGQLRQALGDLGSHFLEHAARRIPEHHVEGDPIAFHLHVLHVLRLDVVAPRDGIDQLGKGLEDLLIGNGHGKGGK